MAENCDSNSEKKSFFQKFLDLFKSTSKKVAEKAKDTVEDVKNSEFAEKVTDAAGKVGEKAKDIVEDIKDSKFAERWVMWLKMSATKPKTWWKTSRRASLRKR